MKNTTNKITGSELLWRLGHSVKAAVKPDAIDLEHRGHRATDWNAEWSRRLAFRLVVTILAVVLSGFVGFTVGAVLVGVPGVLLAALAWIVVLPMGLVWTAFGLRRK